MYFLRLLFTHTFIVLALFPARLWADYKTEFKLSVNVSEETSWGQAANRFANSVSFRTQGRIRIKNYFNGQLFVGQQTTEFQLLQQGVADFAVGSTINWSPQVQELNLFSLPFLFSDYREIDAVQAGEPGKQIMKRIEQKGVVPIAWGENGFRELTNSTRPIRRPEDFHGLRIRVVGIPIFVETFRALGAEPRTLNWDEAQVAFRDGTVDGQENPVALIIPYRLWAAHKHITLWHHVIDPLILAASAQTWATLSTEDRNILREAGNDIMAEQKKEARAGLGDTMTVVEILNKVYGMEVVHLSRADVEAFRDATRPVYARWAEKIGVELVRSAEQIVAGAK